ncbi:MAG: glycosyltransferase [Clostridia bacterium]
MTVSWDTDLRPIGIGLFVDSYSPAVDGVITLVKKYANIISEKYGSSVVIAPYMPGNDEDEQFDLLTFKSVNVPKRPPYRTGMPTFDAKFRKNEMDLKNLDLYHAHSPFGAGMEAVRLAKKYRRPLVATFHSKYYDDFYEATNSEVIAKLGTRMVINFFNKADAVWTVNNASANTLREYGYEGEIEVVNNGTDINMPDNAELLKAETNEFFKLGNGDVLLFVGQMIRQKNIFLIAKAAAEYKKFGRPFKLVYVGDGIAMEETKKLCKELNIYDDCVFTGRINDRRLLSGIYLNASIFVFPSVYDNAPLVVHEAASFSVPSLLALDSNASEGVTDGFNGIIASLDENEIAKKIFNILSNEREYEYVRANACATLAQSWENIVDDVYHKYINIIDKYNIEHCIERSLYI